MGIPYLWSPFIILLSRNGVHTYISHAPVPSFIVFTFVSPLPYSPLLISNHFFVRPCASLYEDLWHFPVLVEVVVFGHVWQVWSFFSVLFFGVGMESARQEGNMVGLHLQ